MSNIIFYWINSKLIIISIIIFTFGLLLSLSSALAGPLGLGFRSEFFLYRLYSILQIDALSMGVAICIGTVLMTGWGAVQLRWVESFLARPRILRVLMVLTAAGVLSVLFLGFGSGPMIAPDSLGYLSFDVSRSAGYPMFLTLIRGVTGALSLLAPIQLAIMFGAFIFLGLTVADFAGNNLLGYAIALLLMLERSLGTFGLTVMSEGLFVPLVALHGAFVLRFITCESRIDLLACFATLAAATLVRPAGYSLFLGVPLLALLVRHRVKMIVPCGLGLAVLFTATGMGVQYVKNGQIAAQSLGGIALLGQVGPLISHEVPFHDQGLMADLEEDLLPFHQKFTRASYPREYWRVTMNAYNDMLWSIMLPVVDRHITAAYPDLTGTDRQMADNREAMAVSLAVIRHAPLKFARHVVAQYYGMWAGVYDLSENVRTLCPRNHELLNQSLATSPDYERLGVRNSRMPEGQLASIAAFTFDTITGLAATMRMSIVALALAASFLCLRRRGDLKQRTAMIYLAVQLNAYYLFVALTQASIPRYPAAFDVFCLTLAALFLKSLLQRPTRKV